jgi:hypothetical protein
MVGKHFQEIFSRELFYEFTSLFVKLSTLHMKRVQKFTSKYESLNVLGQPSPPPHTHSKIPCCLQLVLNGFVMGFTRISLLHTILAGETAWVH